MSVYKVKLGERILDVDGLAGLVALVRDGKLGPEDPVFIPSTGRWHYARSVRQLREHFPAGTAEPTRPAPPAPPREPEPPEEPPHAGEVVPLRRGRWSPEGTGVDVPVFAYAVDADPPESVRLAAAVVVALVLGGLFLVYKVGYAYYYRDRASQMGTAALATPLPPPSPRGTAVIAQQHPTHALAAATPRLAPTPTPWNVDLAPLRAKVASVELSRVSRPDQLGPAMRLDFTRIGVPVHEVALTAQKGPRNAAVPFQLRIDYAPVTNGDRDRRVRDQYVLLAMAGRRASELKLNLASLHVRTLSGGKPVSDAAIAPTLAFRAYAGEATAQEVATAFEPARR